ncbi:cell division protein DivIB [Bacillaceae bacterium]
MQQVNKVPHLKKTLRKKRANRRLLFLLFLFFFVILLLAFFRSPLSKVQRIEVTGTLMLDKREVVEKLGLYKGMPYLNVDAGELEEKLSRYPEVESAEVEKRFPGTIKIAIVESQRVAFWLDRNDTLYPLLENGQILEQHPWRSRFVDLPILSRWPSTKHVPEMAKELAQLDAEVLALISEIQLTPTPTDPYRLRLFMRDGYEVRSSLTNFAKNMKWYPSFVQSLEKANVGKRGIIYMLDGKWFQPYEYEVEGQKEGEEETE